MKGKLTARVRSLDHDVLNVVLGVLAKDLHEALSTLKALSGKGTVTILLSMANQVVLWDASARLRCRGSEASDAENERCLHDGMWDGMGESTVTALTEGVV